MKLVMPEKLKIQKQNVQQIYKIDSGNQDRTPGNEYVTPIGTG